MSGVRSTVTGSDVFADYELRSVIPYAWIGDGERHSLWGAAGVGRGEAEFLDGRFGTDISMEMAAVGYGYALSISTPSFASLKADASTIRLKIEEGEGIPASRERSQRGSGRRRGWPEFAQCLGAAVTCEHSRSGATRGREWREPNRRGAGHYHGLEACRQWHRI